MGVQACFYKVTWNCSKQKVYFKTNCNNDVNSYDLYLRKKIHQKVLLYEQIYNFFLIENIFYCCNKFEFKVEFLLCKIPYSSKGGRKWKAILINT